MAFKGPPDRDNAVEIGYGFDPFYHNRGLATEAVAEMVRWALLDDGVEAVIAETANMNVASMRVLQKVGFVITSATDRFLYWKIGGEGSSLVTPLVLASSLILTTLHQRPTGILFELSPS